jgi:hypothetical protein
MMELEPIKIIPFSPDEYVTLSGEVVKLPEYDPEAVLKALQEEEENGQAKCVES